MSVRACFLVPVFLCAMLVTPSEKAFAQAVRQGRYVGNLRVRDSNAAKIYLPFLNEVLTAELHFVKKVCDPTADQFNAIHREGLKAIQTIGETYGALKRRRVNVETWPDPSEAITAELQHAIDRLLPADVAKTYRAETAARMDARRAADAATIVNLIDRQVLLDARQQEEIFADIRTHWKPHWSQRNVIIFQSRYATLPEPDVLAPHLSDLQQRLWSYRPKRPNVRLSWGMHFATNNILGATALRKFADPSTPTNAVESR